MVQPVARGGEATYGGHAPSGTWPTEFSIRSEKYHLDHSIAIMSTTLCLLLYPIGRAGKTKEVTKTLVDLARGLFEGKLIPPLYACVQVEQLLKSSYEDTEIDTPTVDGKNCLGEYVGSTILWHKRYILLVG